MKKNKPGIEASYLSKFQEKKNNFVSVISTRYSRRHEKMKKMGGGGGQGGAGRWKRKEREAGDDDNDEDDDENFPVLFLRQFLTNTVQRKAIGLEGSPSLIVTSLIGLR